MTFTPYPRLEAIIRWIVFLPVAILSSSIVAYLFGLLNRISLHMYGFDPDSFISRAFLTALSSMVMSSSFVWVGAKVAPKHQTIVAYGLVGFALIIGGFVLYPSWIVSDYWEIWSTLTFVLGSVITAIGVSKGEMELDVND